jgi:hypothetical protein
VPRIVDRLRPRRGGLVSFLLVAMLVGVAAAPLGPGRVRGDSATDHLVISELVTGGASASDEFVEIYNPTAGTLPLEGLELVYVTASGLTVSRRAAWEAGAPDLPARHHLLVANESGAYAGIADAQYASGLAATGGSLALRIQGAATAIDAVGWGNAASTWLEGIPAPAPAPGSSLERLPGGLLGSTRDTDDNASDFVTRLLPDPQNSTSAPTPDGTPPPTSTPTPTGSTPSASPSPSTSPSSTPTPTPNPAVPISTARALPDGTRVTVEGTSLSDSTFTEGGGYVADETAGIAVLVTSGSFERGQRLRITGTVDDRFAQRTLRASGADVVVVGSASDPDPMTRTTGVIGEGVEGTLVRTSGRITGSPTTLSAGLAYEIDDGSGAIRVVVGSGTGIATTGWTSGARLEIVGVVGQRDSTGTGTSGYRLQPRDPSDVIVLGAETFSPSPSTPPGPGDPTQGPSPQPGGVMSIAEARALPKHAAARIQGTVTLAPGLVDPVSAVIQDGTGAILLRVGDEAGPIARGDRVEVSGVRSTLAGMETLRVTGPALRLGTAPDPTPVALRTGHAGEVLEAQLVRVRGAVVSSARRVSSGTVSFELDDGSGPLRVYLAAALGAESADLVSGAWVEATGVLGQETTGAHPLRGYRVWPRTATEVVVGASPTEAMGAAASPATGAAGGSVHDAGGAAGASLAEIAEMPADLETLHVGATLVHGPWPELGVAGVLWDGERIVAIASESAPGVASLLGDAAPPVVVELTGLAARGAEPRTGVPLVALGTGPGDVVLRDGPPHPPAGEPIGPGARWVSVVGRLGGTGDGLRFLRPDGPIAVRLLCDDPQVLPSGPIQLLGVGLGEPSRLLVPCRGVRPAPTLDRPIAEAFDSASLARADHGSPSAVPTPSDDVEDVRGFAAALLGTGSLAVTAAAVLARRARPDPEPFDEPPGGAASGDGGAEPAMPRSLTLVTVPRERGSP